MTGSGMENAGHWQWHGSSAAGKVFAMSTARPTLGVIIPNFNYARFLPQALNSVLAQEPAFDEITVVDDGSTDDSHEVLAQYAGRIKTINTSNSGQLNAYRTGISATTSDYIYSLDADDYVVPGFVARLHKVMPCKPVKIQFQLAGTDVAGVATGSVFPVFPNRYDAAAMREDNIKIGFYICPPSSGNVFSREALARIDLASFDPRGPIDRSPALALPYLGEIVSLSEALAFYRVHDASLSSGSRPTITLLRRELSQFQAAWNEVDLALGPRARDFAKNPPLYIRERQLMIACLNSQVFVGFLVQRYVSKLWQTHVPLRQKLVLSAWAMALLVPSKHFKTKLVWMKRSSVNRPQILQSAINLVTILRRQRRAT